MYRDHCILNRFCFSFTCFVNKGCYYIIFSPTDSRHTLSSYQPLRFSCPISNWPPSRIVRTKSASRYSSVNGHECDVQIPLHLFQAVAKVQRKSQFLLVKQSRVIFHVLFLPCIAPTQSTWAQKILEQSDFANISYEVFVHCLHAVAQAVMSCANIP